MDMAKGWEYLVLNSVVILKLLFRSCQSCDPLYCVGKEHGSRHVDVYDPHYYYHCDYDRAQYKSCAPPLVFDMNINSCNWADPAATTPIPIETSGVVVGGYCEVDAGGGTTQTTTGTTQTTTGITQTTTDTTQTTTSETQTTAGTTQTTTSETQTTAGTTQTTTGTTQTTTSETQTTAGTTQTTTDTTQTTTDTTKTTTGTTQTTTSETQTTTGTTQTTTSETQTTAGTTQTTTDTTQTTTGLTTTVSVTEKVNLYFKHPNMESSCTIHRTITVASCTTCAVTCRQTVGCTDFNFWPQANEIGTYSCHLLTCESSHMLTSSAQTDFYEWI